MNVLVLLISCLAVFGVCFAWMKIRKPWTPYMNYTIKRRWGDLFGNILGFYIFLFVSGYLESSIVQIPDMRVTFVMLFTRVVSLIFTGLWLRLTFSRPTHPGPFSMPAVMNVCATVSQYEALSTGVSFAEFGASKALRLLVVGVYGSKNNKERIMWAIISIIAAKFIFYYEFSRSQWSIPPTTGLVFLLLFILTDSFTSITQEAIYNKFKVSNMTMMYHINAFMLVLLMPQIFLEKDTLPVTMRAIGNNPTYLLHVSGLTAASGVAQFFMLRIIRQFGSLTFVSVCLLRTLVTIVFAKYVRVGYWEWFEIVEVMSIILIVSYILNKRKPWLHRTKVPKALRADLMPLVSD